MSIDGRDQKYIDELISALEATTRLITSLIADMQENSELVIQLKEKMQVIEAQIILMETILRGDGISESLLTRFALLERDVETVLAAINAIEKEKAIIKAEASKAGTERMKIWIGAMVTLIASILSAITAYYMK